MYLLLAATSHFKWGRLKVFVQKVLYCAEDDAVRGGTSPFPTFPFFRFYHGPFSKEVAQTAEQLARRGFLASQAGPITARGRLLVADLRPVVERFPIASAALASIDNYAKRFASMNLKSTLREVYSRPAMGPFGLTTVENVPEGEDMIWRELAPEVAAEHEELFDLIAWRLTQTEDEEKVERESPLLPDDKAQAFLARYLA
jgi:hypothetical protein